MEDDTKARFDEVDKRQATLEKRFDDIKWYLGGVTGVFTIGFSVLVLVLSWNYSSERASLRDFQRDLKAELGKLDLPPEVNLLGLNGSPLEGQDVSGSMVVNDKGEHLLRISHILRNRGDSPTGHMFVKLYTQEGIPFDDKSTDESEYKYEAYIDPSRLDPPELPGKFSFQESYDFVVLGKADVKDGRHQALLKVYYGKGRVTQARVTIVVAKTKP